MLQWVVDTWVLVKCGETNEPICLGAVSFLFRILKRDMLCLDFEGEILKEYNKYFAPHTHVSRWWDEMVKHGHKFAWRSNKLNEKHRHNLINKLGFDKSDIKFVGVAEKTNDRLLVAEESDYCKGVCDYLERNLSIKVLDVHQSLDFNDE